MAGVNLMRHVKIDGVWRRLPVARRTGAQGAGAQEYDFSRVLLRGQPVVVDSGTFHLEYRDQNGKKVRPAVGDHPREVKAALETQRRIVDLRRQGLAVPDAPQIVERRVAREGTGGRTVAEVAKAFRESPQIDYRRKSYTKYRNALDSFAEWTRRKGGTTAVADLSRDDIRGFLTHLVRVAGLDASTAVDKGRIVAKIMRDAGAPIVMKRGDWPKVTERQPSVYRPEQLRPLWKAATPEEYCLFQTFLLTGMREMEVAHLTWQDFDARAKTLHVRKKPGFDPKTYHERSVPVFAVLAELLRDQRKRQEDAGRTEVYIFPTRTQQARQGSPGGQANGHLLRKLKLLALRAGANCGNCRATEGGKPVTCATRPVCEEYFLHKFRHTYATTMLHDGMDVVSLQKLLGHKDIESTMKYLRSLVPEDLHRRVSETSLATRFA